MTDEEVTPPLGSPVPTRRLASSARLLVLAALALLATFLLAPAPAEAAIDHDAERTMACQVSALRRAHGLAPHRVASDLTQIARDHARVMARRNRLHHNPDFGSQVTGWSRVAENVGVGPSVSSVQSGLVASSGHRRNLLDGRMTEIGIGVERSGNRTWVVQLFRQPTGQARGSTTSCSASAVPGGGIAIVGDWNGDGRQTPGKFVNGRWYLSNGLSSHADLSFSYGRSGDHPVVGDWNGNGQHGIGVVRDGRWHLRETPSAGTGQISFSYGDRDDLPLAGDWNGNGRYGIGIVRDGTWHLRQTPSGGPGQTVFTYGRVTQGDVPLIGDWNGNGQPGVGIVRNDAWHLRQTPSGGPAQSTFRY